MSRHHWLSESLEKDLHHEPDASKRWQTPDASIVVAKYMLVSERRELIIPVMVVVIILQHCRPFFGWWKATWAFRKEKKEEKDTPGLETRHVSSPCPHLTCTRVPQVTLASSSGKCRCNRHGLGKRYPRQNLNQEFGLGCCDCVL